MPTPSGWRLPPACRMPAAKRLGLLVAAAIALSAACAGTVAAPSAPAPVDTVAIDALFADHAGGDGPGAAVSVQRGGQRVFASAYGLANLEAGTAMTPHTPIHVASVSKQFTAFAIALLADEGRVDLDADVRRYLPWVPDFGQPVTVRQLVLHTSGLRDQWALFTLGGQDMDGRLRQRQIVSMVAHQQALNFPPGSEYAYSNTGYTLLAEIVRTVTGQSLRAFAHERIFAPLGMTRTFFFDDVEEVVRGRAESYARDGDGPWRKTLLNYDNAGATSLFTTAEDLAKWAGNFARPTVGDAALIAAIGTPGTLADGTPIDYAFGLQPGRTAGHRSLAHGGADAGFRAHFVVFPDHDLAVTVLANTPLDVAGKAEAIARLYLPDTGSAAEPLLPAAVTDPARLEEVAGRYLAEHDPLLMLEVRDGKLEDVHRHGEVEHRADVVLRTDDSIDDGSRLARYFRVVRDARGNVVALERHQAGRPQARYARQSAPPALTAQALDAYVGDYRSPELDVTWRVHMHEDALAIDSLWTPEPVALRAVAQDRFEAGMPALDTVVFTRGADGAVEGLKTHSGRVRHVRFERIGR